MTEQERSEKLNLLLDIFVSFKKQVIGMNIEAPQMQWAHKSLDEGFLWAREGLIQQFSDSSLAVVGAAENSPIPEDAQLQA